MIRLVNDLLQLSKMDSTDYRLQKNGLTLLISSNRIIDRFEMSKEQNVTFKRKLPDQAIFLKLMKIR